MANRRIISLWFPRLGVERVLRQRRDGFEGPMAIVQDQNQMQIVSSLTPAAEAVGLRVGQPLRDAQAMCPELITRLRNPQAELTFLRSLARWAGKFTPWVGIDAPSGLTLDITGCAHLFGSEEGLVEAMCDDCQSLGVSVYAGCADTVGAAWALARYSGQTAQSHRSGDAIDQEARATRSRAVKRRNWERGGARPTVKVAKERVHFIAPSGVAHDQLKDLPIAALRLDSAIVEQLSRLGLRRIGDLAGQPRAGLARRFGKELVLRLDQAMGSTPEPVSPIKDIPHFGVRMGFPDPIGLHEDIIAALDRLLPRLCDKLTLHSKGARRVRVQGFCADDTMSSIDVGLAKASDDPERIRPLLILRLDELDVGFGLDVLRLEAYVTEPLDQREMTGHLEAGARVKAGLQQENAVLDLIGRLGARLGMDAITRLHPAQSHIPEKTYNVLSAAWSEPCENWPDHHKIRPTVMWPVELIQAPENPTPPSQFVWRGRRLEIESAVGPERIAPEWWLDDPNWRSGVRDYWRVTCKSGDQLWLFFAYGATMSGGWFCQGQFG